MPKTFSTDLIYGQQKIMQTIRLVRLDSGRYATKYHYEVVVFRYVPQIKLKKGVHFFLK